MALSRSVESNHNIVFDCKYHVVFCPKYRKKVLIEPVDVRLKELFLEKAQELRAEVVEMEIMPDHVHLLITCDPQFGIHRIVKHLKGYTSRVLRMEFRHLKSRLPSLWTNSYFVATVGTVQLDVIKQYIESQKERSD
ncbi:IS200/IS605 family transposase [Brevibacillus laterosporus]|nr:IS200/IS605 family transposase [Brevibacillus laterosporus]MED2006054.1 IS200/IS605 family transposase [Brevibacillus laterosporus]MED4766249.1 IS200/IS605 family transposase [Brevibacillus laterosporus]NKQ20587.1 IS200/IS605 family transposase [Brevibacillus laterosporus]WNX32515.1 IS200/IS605 family transposase [Brevibacillus laterosporus]